MATLTLDISQTHIRTAHQRGSQVTPLQVALVSASPFRHIEIGENWLRIVTDEGLVWMGALPANLIALQQRFGQGLPVTPETFMLELTLQGTHARMPSRR